MELAPYVFFNGRAAEAAEYYRSVLDAEVQMLMYYRDSPEKQQIPPGAENQVMHMSLKIGESVLMASDGCGGASPCSFAGFSLSLTLGDVGEAEGMFHRLAAYGQIHMPLTPTFFARTFGVVADKFGLTWMIYVPAS